MISNDMKCKGCGGQVKFVPGTASLKCPSCGLENIIESMAEVGNDAEDINLEAYLENYVNEQESIEVQALNCGSCSAQLLFDEHTVSGNCPYCDSPFVTSKPESRGVMKPQYILPFAIDDKNATESFRKWISGLWFAPNDFKKRLQIAEKFKGMYLPFWAYDCDTQSAYSAEISKTVTHRATSREEEDDQETSSTETESVYGKIMHNFNDVVVSGTKSLPGNILNALEPWELEALTAYDERFLKGFCSETYQIDVKEAYAHAKELMKKELKEQIEKKYMGMNVNIKSINTIYSNPSFKHLSLPVWVSSFRYDGKLYQFAVNARTGKVQGQRPWSILKIAMLVIPILIAVGAFVYVVISA